jgi:hypothetical protein
MLVAESGLVRLLAETHFGNVNYYIRGESALSQILQPFQADTDFLVDNFGLMCTFIQNSSYAKTGIALADSYRNDFGGSSRFITQPFGSGGFCQGLD